MLHEGKRSLHITYYRNHSYVRRTVVRGEHTMGAPYRTIVRLPGAQSFPPDFRMYGATAEQPPHHRNRPLKLFSARFSEVPVRLTSASRPLSAHLAYHLRNYNASILPPLTQACRT